MTLWLEMMNVQNELSQKGLLAAVVKVEGVQVRETSGELKSLIQELLAERRNSDWPPAPIKDAVRALLRSGGFKPSGRNKPASEYLAQAAKEDEFPCINNLVDINNYVSLLCGLPISLLDLRATTDRVRLRHGAEGEKYVFNHAAQEIDLAGLLCICRDDSGPGVPLGNPVKDSMEGKLKSDTSSVLGAIYIPRPLAEQGVVDADKILSLFEGLLLKHGGGSASVRLLA